MLQNVYVVDDDHDVRSSISFMLDIFGLSSRSFSSGEEFLAKVVELPAGCILLDIRMPVLDGFQVMNELEKSGIDWPVILITGHGDIKMAVRALKDGAVDFIEKPFAQAELMATIDRAFVLLQDRGGKAEMKRAAKERVARLTQRETEVLRELMSGHPNKMIAWHLDISLRTVEMHRANMMNRLHATSLAEALALAVQAEL